jgi:hypothetical protein
MRNILNTALLVALIGSSQELAAQPIGYKEITEKRIEFIAPRLPLTAAEAEKFWPLFREFHAEREKLSKAGRPDDKKSVPQLKTEKDYQNAINQMLESKLNQTTLLKKYNEKYLEILPPSKVYQLYLLDEEFNKKLLNELKEQNRPRRP